MRIRSPPPHPTLPNPQAPEQLFCEMRLLHTESLRLYEFFEKDTPSYAILSHRWEKGEVLYQDMITAAENLKKPNKHGYSKLLGACDLAKKQGYQWI